MMTAGEKGDSVVLFMKDPKNCGGCLLNDPFNFCCKAAKKSYGNENLIGDSKPPFCPLCEMVKEPYGNFKIVGK